MALFPGQCKVGWLSLPNEAIAPFFVGHLQSQGASIATPAISRGMGAG